ncbi:twin transmembrane helix small protein [Methyloterricola oryzae]|uniref:twin transmembrane helix small protein n=1 Tax=Methyloterricola oryzae TaxID=1495050 RepID=UPI0005EB1839|nr:twin transmembrane helix small protein [Methyloterricola oryzae]
MLTKTLIVFVLIMIIASLGTAMVYLLKDRERSPRTVKALTARIGMSLALFFLLLLGYRAGILHPHGLKPGPAQASQAEAARAAP